MKKKLLILIGLLVLGIILAGCSQKNKTESSSGDDITIFKSSSCGCCGIYAKYMQNQGFNVKIENVENMDMIKSEFNIPMNLQSCHTVKIGDYFVEGHVPIEAVEKLLTEKPDVAGIAMPGMPSGSPGMSGSKSGSWVIYAVDHNGQYSEFMSL